MNSKTAHSYARTPTHSTSGFTLLELLVVISIIAILATIVGIKVAGEPGRARVAKARAEVATIDTALELYRMDNGGYPTMRQGLGALCRRPDTPPAPANYREEGYLKKNAVPLDPWDHEYVYLVPGPENTPYDVVSYGGDGEPGGDGEAADIRSSEF